MSGNHLDERSLDGLLRGGLDPAEARRLAAHLREPCVECERFLAGHGGVLDGMADRALGASAAPAEAGDDVEFARIMRAVRRRRARPRVAVAALAAALVAVAGVTLAVLWHRPTGQLEEGVKGFESRALPVRLRALLAPAAVPGTVPELSRVASGAEVPQSANLVFRIETGAPAELALVRVGPVDFEVVFRARAEGPGTIDVSAAGKPAAYSLRGLSGRQRFVLVASPGTLGPERIEAAAAALRDAPLRGDARLVGLTLSGLEVVVR